MCSATFTNNQPRSNVFVKPNDRNHPALQGTPPWEGVAQRSSFPCQRESSIGLTGFLRARVLQNVNSFRPRSHAPAWECIERVLQNTNLLVVTDFSGFLRAQE